MHIDNKATCTVYIVSKAGSQPSIERLTLILKKRDFWRSPSLSGYIIGGHDFFTRVTLALGGEPHTVTKFTYLGSGC